MHDYRGAAMRERERKEQRSARQQVLSIGVYCDKQNKFGVLCKQIRCIARALKLIDYTLPSHFNFAM